MKSLAKVLLLVSLTGMFGCSEGTPPLPAAIASAGDYSAKPSPAPEIAETIAAPEAPKLFARATLISGRDITSALENPLAFSEGAKGDPAALELVRHDIANGIASRCAAPQTRKIHNAIASPSGPAAEIEADPLKVGLLPVEIKPALAAQLTQKTRVWQFESQGFDFYKILSDGHAEGLRSEIPAVACIRYTLFRATSANGPELYSDMIFSVTRSQKTPEIIRIMPVRLYYRDFPTLADRPEVTQAAIKVSLGLRTFSLERNSGRLAIVLPSLEMVVELLNRSSADRAIYQLYDPVSGPGITIPLPPWDYSPTSVNPRHNLSVLGVMVTEIADFDWLQSQIHTLWPSWEYEATDVSKIKVSAQLSRRAHIADAAASP